MKTQFALCAAAGIIPFVRPPGKAYSYTSRLLDVGAFGLLYQMVESAEEARELVAWTRYPPTGVRGAVFGGAHDDYTDGDMAEKAVAAMDRTVVMALIETKAGLENVDEIMAVDGVDIAHLGHADLSLSLGIPGQFDHPDLQGGIDKIVEAATKVGKAAGAMAPTRRKPVWAGFTLAGVVVALDQVSKAWLLAWLEEQGAWQQVTGFFNLVMVWNRGISFGMFQSGETGRWLLVLFSTLVCLGMAIWLWRQNKFWPGLALGAVIGGALGNIIDRIWRGAVADFFDFHMKYLYCRKHS